jgi:hypothetical protein
MMLYTNKQQTNMILRRNKNSAATPQPKEAIVAQEVAEQPVDSSSDLAAKAEEERIKSNLREITKVPRERYRQLSQKAQRLFEENEELRRVRDSYMGLNAKYAEARGLHDTEAEAETSVKMRDAQTSADSLVAELLAGDIAKLKKDWSAGEVPRIVPGIIMRGSGGQYFTFEDTSIPRFKVDMTREVPRVEPQICVPVPDEEKWASMNLPDTEIPLQTTFYGFDVNEDLPAGVGVFKDPQMSDCSLEDLRRWGAVAEQAVQPIGG